MGRAFSASRRNAMPGTGVIFSQVFAPTRRLPNKPFTPP